MRIQPSKQERLSLDLPRLVQPDIQAVLVNPACLTALRLIHYGSGDP